MATYVAGCGWFLVLYLECSGMSIHEPSAEPTSIPSGRRKCCRCNGVNARCKFCACAKANRACTNCLPSKHSCCQNTSSELTTSSNAPIDSTSSSQPLYQHTSQFSHSQQLPLLQLPSSSISLQVFGSLSPSHLRVAMFSSGAKFNNRQYIDFTTFLSYFTNIHQFSAAFYKDRSTLFTFHFSAVSIITTTISFGLLVFPG